MNLKLWPFDVQKCEIKVGSWTYSGHQIDLQNDADIDVNFIIPICVMPLCSIELFTLFADCQLLQKHGVEHTGYIGRASR